MIGVMPAALAPLLTWTYWFSSYPSAFIGATFWIMAGLALTGVVGGLALMFWARLIADPSWRKVVRRLGKLGITLGILVWMSFFFTQTYTPFLGSRFWFLLWLLVGFVWLGFIARYAIWVLPGDRAERARQQDYRKYLPGGR